MTRNQKTPAAQAQAVKAKATAGMKTRNTAAQVEEMRTRVETLRGQGQDIVIEQARLTLAVVDGGFIGKEKDPTTGKVITAPGAAWQTQGAYAAALGVSPSYLSGLVSLGRAMARGIVPGHKEWDVVYLNRQSIGKAVAPKDGKTPLVRDIVAAAKAGTRAVAAGKAKDPRATADEKKAKATAAKAKADEGTYPQVKEALAVLRSALKDGSLSPAQVTATRASLATLLAQYGGEATTAAKADTAAA